MKIGPNYYLGVSVPVQVSGISIKNQICMNAVGPYEYDVIKDFYLRSISIHNQKMAAAMLFLKLSSAYFTRVRCCFFLLLKLLPK